MKKISLLLLLMLTISAAAFSQRMVQFPVFNRANSNRLQIDSLKATTTETVLYCHLNGYLPGGEYYMISSKSVLIGESGTEYKLDKAVGVDMDKRNFIKGEAKPFTLHFKPLKGSDEVFTYMGVNENGKGNEFLIRDIHAYNEIDRPVIQTIETDQLIIDKVELKKNETVVHCSVLSAPYHWAIINSTDLIEDNTGKRYKLLKSDGYDLDTKIFMPRSGRVSCTLSFEPMGAGATEINYISLNKDKGEEVYLKGVSLLKTRVKVKAATEYKTQDNLY